MLRNQKKKNKPWLVFIIVSFFVVAGGWILITKFEGKKPIISIHHDSSSISASQNFSGNISDSKSGLRKVWIGLLKDNKEYVFMKEEFPSKGFLQKGKVFNKSIKILIKPKKIGISDGKAIFRMVVWDYSWRSWFHGNKTYIEEEVIIDTKPPEIDIITKRHYINQGGAGLVIYKLSEPCKKSGVYVEDNLFPGYSGYFEDKNIYLSFFALKYTQGPGTELFVTAIDLASNTKRAGFSHLIKKKRFRKDTINLSDRFLNWKVPEFDIDEPENTPDDVPPVLAKFLVINQQLRKKNGKVIRELGKNSDKKLYWDGGFLRLPKSAPRARFADHRSYKYKGKVVDHQVHLGIDLASIEKSDIPAANHGKVIMADNIGIYGKTIVIDHGFGLLSLYSHLSKFNVRKGDIVSKGDIIGQTGTTGLAGGDHLHFSMLVRDVFVNPIEWWDTLWIKNNITDKINDAKELFH